MRFVPAAAVLALALAISAPANRPEHMILMPFAPNFIAWETFLFIALLKETLLSS